MKWFKRKKRSKSLDARAPPDPYSAPRFGTPLVSASASAIASALSAALLAKLPIPILQRIFNFVCPHAQDDSFETSEQSGTEDGCMLCDLRDLAHCTRVSRRWRKAAIEVMYHHIRIEPVHYCDLEEILAEKRKRRSRFDRNGQPEDTAATRLLLLARTLRDNKGGFALNVRFLKTPHMTREASKPDLARIVAVCPNLRYIDLPDGFFRDDPSCNTLKQEVQSRCPDIRKMTYAGGSEQSLALLGTQLWRNLEVLELIRLELDFTGLRRSIGSLPQLRALKVVDTKSFDDDLLQQHTSLPPFPPLIEVIFQNTPNVTAAGLTSYLSRIEVQDTLKTLSLTNTGARAPSLHAILASASKLEKLSVIESVTGSFPAGITPLASDSMKTFHYEITDASSATTVTRTAASYYDYLRSSLFSRGLPNLRELYVRDPDFPESLTDLAPPLPAFHSDLSPPLNPFLSPAQSPHSFELSSADAAQNNRYSSNNPFAQKVPITPRSGIPGIPQDLVVYSKGLDEMEWNFSQVQTASAHGRRGSASVPRPVSSYGLEQAWTRGHGARKSVIVPNGWGGFLRVPDEQSGRPNSSAGEKRASRVDLWR